MSIKLELQKAKFDVKPEKQAQLQYIPASIASNSPANISNYFNNYTEDTDGKLSNAIRGYPLEGCKFTVPEPYQGIVFQELNRPLEENAERTFKVNGVFSDFTYWNYNKQPSENDLLKQALQWTDFANALHKPITMDEFEAETTAVKQEDK